MVVIGVIVIIAALIALCWVMFNLAVYALPLFAALMAGRYAHDCGIDWPGAVLIGLVAGAGILALATLALAFLRPVWLKLGIAALFVIPAGVAGYSMVHGLGRMITHDPVSLALLGGVGAAAVGITSYLRLLNMVTTAFPPPQPAYTA